MSKEKKFEENLADLEAIVQKLESGDVALEEAITEFQKGMKLSKELQETLTASGRALAAIIPKGSRKSASPAKIAKSSPNFLWLVNCPRR